MFDRKIGPAGQQWTREAMKALRSKLENFEEDSEQGYKTFADVLKRQQKAEALHLAALRFATALSGANENPREYEKKKNELLECLDAVRCDKGLSQLEVVRGVANEIKESMGNPEKFLKFILSDSFRRLLDITGMEDE